MPDNAINPSQHSKRQQYLTQLSQIYSRIQFMELSQHEFSTENLHQLSLLAQYSIHPMFSSHQMHQFHLKLTEKYWARFQDLRALKSEVSPQQRQSLPQKDLDQHHEPNKISEISQEEPILQPENLNACELNPIEEKNETEAIQMQLKQLQQVRLQLKVPKTYRDIKKFFVQFDDQQIDPKNPIKSKILLLNSWTAIPFKALNLSTKKLIESPCKIDSATYLENVKLGKSNRKDSNNIEPSKTIILGKNESTETKQMKHILKVQAKTNFVQEKQKQQSKLDQVQKKSIELNYLLNIITREFFDDFCSDIIKIIRSNLKTIEVFCEKIIEKVKEQHNFIEIYVDLIKKLTKVSLSKDSQNPTDSKKFNQLQQFFVTYLQECFIKQLSIQVTPSNANFNEYKYRKEMMGMCKFIGQLIKQRILSKNIFKVCFWQIVYRYVQKVKDHPQNDIVNECLIEGIVTICDSMGNAELLKMIEKEKECKIIQNDQVALISRFEEMMNALVNPNDEDHVAREQSYKNLIESVKVEEYPHILAGLMQIFGSKRMKLQFLIQQWKSKLQILKSTQVNDMQRLETQNPKRQPSEVFEEGSEAKDDLFEIKKQINEFINELKFQTESQRNSKQSTESSLKQYEGTIKQYINSKQTPQTTQRIFKLLTVQFFNHFADCKNFSIVQDRVKYFLNFAKTLNLKENVNNLLLDIICKDEIENLMIIECDYHFLIDGLCSMMVELMFKSQVTQEEVEEKMKNSYDPEDEDMNEFCQKLNKKITKMWHSEARKLSEDDLYED